MKQQTYVSYLEDKDGKMVDFERWPYKRPETILKKLQELYQYPIYKKYLERSTQISIYATPDGYNKVLPPVLSVPIEYNFEEYQRAKDKA